MDTTTDTRTIPTPATTAVPTPGPVAVIEYADGPHQCWHIPVAEMAARAGFPVRWYAGAFTA